MRICKNEITDEIRNKFGANPLKVPDSTYQPLLLLEIDRKRSKILGMLEDLLMDEFNYDLPLNSSDLAEVSGSETNKIGINLGFSILENFVTAFGGQAPDFKTALNKTKKISFSFSNVQRIWFSVLKLGKILSNHNIKADPNNIFIKNIMGKNKSRLALVTDIIISNSFSCKSYNENDLQVNIDVPLIEGMLGDMNLDMNIEKAGENEIKFNKENPLTFAFSCVEILIDENGNIRSGNWIENVKFKGALDQSVENSSELDIETEAKILLDEDDYNPLLID